MKDLVVNTQNATFIFVTRDEDRPFTLEEAQEYLSSYESAEEVIENPTLTFPDRPVVPNKDAEFSWHIPNDRNRKSIFMKDLRSGIQFCVDKYGQPQEVIEAEARRLGLGGF